MCGEYRTVAMQSMAPMGSPPRVWGIRPARTMDVSETEDHPHVCGEYLGHPVWPCILIGSPPRVWGIRHESRKETFGVGITPTCVGNTWPPFVALWFIQDHPHVCGEYLQALPLACGYQGSPPRVWGIPAVKSSLSLSVRITPTCVGNTPQWPCDWPPRRDHPHVCGEYLLSVILLARLVGSPPRVWGIPCGDLKLQKRFRITPTCVGNTEYHPGNRTEVEDHPHVCGEYL